MCGLHALNSILRALQLTEITAPEIHALAKDLATRECALIYAQDSNMVLDLEVDPSREGEKMQVAFFAFFLHFLKSGKLHFFCVFFAF